MEGAGSGAAAARAGTARASAAPRAPRQEPNTSRSERKGREEERERELREREAERGKRGRQKKGRKGREREWRRLRKKAETLQTLSSENSRSQVGFGLGNLRGAKVHGAPAFAPFDVLGFFVWRPTALVPTPCMAGDQARRSRNPMPQAPSKHRAIAEATGAGTSRTRT